MFECVSPCVDEIKHHGNPSQTRPCRLSHESGIDLLFWVCVKKKNFYCYSHASSPRNQWSQIRTVKLFNTLYTTAIPDPLLLSQYSHLLLVVPQNHQSIYNTYLQHYHFLKWNSS